MSIIKECIHRANMTGEPVPAANVIADVLHMAANEAARWSNRCDDAMRIQDWLYEASVAVRLYAKEFVNEQEKPVGTQRPGTGTTG